MKTIYKYPFRPTDRIVIDMPEGAEILCVQMQHGTPQVWAVVNPDAMPKARVLCLRGTGHAMKGNEGHYVGTFQMDGGMLVFHLFEAVQS